jgi:hypothetical protein
MVTTVTKIMRFDSLLQQKQSKLECLFLTRLFQHSMIIANQLLACPNEAHLNKLLKNNFPALISNIRLGLKRFSRNKTLQLFLPRQ